MNAPNPKITQPQEAEITNLLSQVAAGMEGWSSNALDTFIVRVKAVAADEKRKNTKAARMRENTRLYCYGKALDALLAEAIVTNAQLQAALDQTVESDTARTLLGLSPKPRDSNKPNRPGRPRGSKNKAPKRGGLEAVDMEKGLNGAVQQAANEDDEQQRIDAQKNSEQVGQQESQDTPIDEPQQHTDNAQDQQEAATYDTTTEQDDEKWAAQFPNKPGSPREQGGIYLGVLKEEREEPKSLGAKWDKAAGQWYTLATDLTPFKPWLRSLFPENPASDQAEDGVQKKRVYLIIPYKEAEQKAKEMGAIYDEDCKRYYVADGDDPQLFVQSGFRIE